MTDVVDATTRSRMMAGIKGRNTKPELIIRSGLHAMGYRFRLHRRDLPGRPDIVLPKHRAVIFVNGCFWHGHDCHLYRLPATRTEFWRQKIETNRQRDRRNSDQLFDAGWRVASVWECALKGKGKLNPTALRSGITDWINSTSSEAEWRGEA